MVTVPNMEVRVLKQYKTLLNSKSEKYVYKFPKEYSLL